MAIAFDANLGTNGPTALGATTIVLTTIAAAANGSTIVVCVGCWDTLDMPLSVTDSAGNVYQMDVLARSSSEANEQGAIFSAYAPSGLASGGTITATYSGSAEYRGICAASFTGLPASGQRVNASIATNQTAAAAWNSGSLITDVADCLVFGFAHKADDFRSTPDADVIEIHDFGAAAEVDALTTAYKIVSATGTYDISGTFAGAGTHGGVNLAVAYHIAYPAGTPQWVGVGTVAAGIGAVVPGLPAGWAADDIFLLFCESLGEEAVSAPTGWTATADSPQNIGTTTTGTRLTSFWRRAVAGDTAPTVADPGDHCIARIHAFRDCIGTGDPWDVTSGGIEDVSDTSLSAIGDTTTVASCLVVVGTSSGADVARQDYLTWANTDLPGLAKFSDNFTNLGSGGGHAVFAGRKASSGVFGSTTATLITAHRKAFITLALKPSVIADERPPRPLVTTHAVHRAATR